MSFSLGNILFLVIMLRCQVFLPVTAQNYQLTSSCGGSVQAGGSCTLMCYTGDASQTAIQWLNETTFYRVSQGSCSSTSPSLPAEYTTSCPSSTNYTLTINNAVYGRDRLSWRCDHQFGGRESNRVQIDVSVTLTSVTVTRNATSVSCVAVSNPPPSMTLYRDGISVATSPAAVEGDTGWTATINYQLTGTSRNSLYYCQASNTQTSVNSTYSYPETAPVPVPEACGFALIAVIILVVLLVMKIATDVIFVGYRWADKCEQIIDTDKRKYILYWICFVQGIINSICGVTFFIVIFATCSESLGEGLPIAVIVIGIIVGSIGVINIVMCLCCCCCPKSSDPGKSDDPSPWLCCCCLGTIHPKDKSSRDHPPPSSLPPIPPSMASPRKPPVPPSSTTPRTLPSPTSDPASDSAVNPSVHLEPLSVEEPKKKKKKKKKRKTTTTTEAGEESSDQPMNPTRDSDE